MSRPSRMLGLTVIGAGLSLLALLAAQVVLLQRSLESERAAFRRSVDGALAAVVAKLEAREALQRVWTVSFVRKGQRATAVINDDPNRPTLLAALAAVPKVQADGGDIVLTLGVAQQVRVVVVGPYKVPDVTVMDELRSAGRSTIPIARLAAAAGVPGGGEWVRLYLDDVPFDVTVRQGQVVAILAHPTVVQSRSALIDKIIEELVVVSPTPIEKRISASDLAAVVREALAERGIRDACVWGVATGTPRRMTMASQARWIGALAASPLTARLFPNDAGGASDDVVFHFPGRSTTLFGAHAAPILAAFLFIVTTAACLGLLVRVLMAQRRFAAAMSDFVANMTHEFKTPISTIALASDALGEDVVVADRARQAKYRGMIRRECDRMQAQAQTILEMAALESGELDLCRSRLDFHDLVRRAAEPFAVRAEAIGGSVTLALSASDPMVDGDPVHLQNVIHNLLDNAVKYTRRVPHLVVRTEDRGPQIEVAVSDNGIGLRPDEQRRVFDKYYRAPTGNVHDVKGFGLGLSYVAAIVREHGGSVGVRSEPGQGSTFEIRLPRGVRGHRGDEVEASR